MNRFLWAFLAAAFLFASCKSAPAPEPTPPNSEIEEEYNHDDLSNDDDDSAEIADDSHDDQYDDDEVPELFFPELSLADDPPVELPGPAIPVEEPPAETSPIEEAPPTEVAGDPLPGEALPVEEASPTLVAEAPFPAEPPLIEEAPPTVVVENPLPAESPPAESTPAPSPPLPVVTPQAEPTPPSPSSVVTEAPPPVEASPSAPPAPSPLTLPAEALASPTLVREPPVVPSAPQPSAPVSVASATPPLVAASTLPLPAAASPPVEKTTDDIVFSRIAHLTVGQLLEIPFRGSGWTFLGEQGNRRGVAYDSRRLDPEGQSFVFRAEAPGAYILKFSRQDHIRDYLLTDYVQVIVEDAPLVSGSFALPSNRGRVVASPRWPSSLDEAAVQDRDRQNITSLDGAVTPPLAASAPAVSPAQADSPPSAAASAPPVATPSAPVAAIPSTEAAAEPSPGPNSPPPLGISPDVLISRAREAYNAGKFADAIAALDQFRQQSPGGSDEAWWLYGQSLEANGPQRDIRGALDYYRRIIRDYPQSQWYAEARRRISYLERYYFNIQ